MKSQKYDLVLVDWWKYLNFFSAPYIKVTDVSDDQVLQKGDELNLHCNFISNTEYTIKWYKISKNSYISRPEKNEGNQFDNVSSMKHNLQMMQF